MSLLTPRIAAAKSVERRAMALLEWIAATSLRAEKHRHRLVRIATRLSRARYRAGCYGLAADNARLRDHHASTLTRFGAFVRRAS